MTSHITQKTRSIIDDISNITGASTEIVEAYIAHKAALLEGIFVEDVHVAEEYLCYETIPNSETHLERLSSSGVPKCDRGDFERMMSDDSTRLIIGKKRIISATVGVRALGYTYVRMVANRLLDCVKPYSPEEDNRQQKIHHVSEFLAACVVSREIDPKGALELFDAYFENELRENPEYIRQSKQKIANLVKNS